jgi:hypothetical protein
VPHNFIKINATTPNPGLRRREDVEEIVRRHHGELVDLWFDDRKNPAHSWVMIANGDVDGMMNDLHGHQLIRLWLPGELEDC